MRWNKLKKMAFDHPYFEYKKHLLSEDEAERILSKGYIGVEEFMQNVRARCEQPGAIPSYGEVNIPHSTHKHRHIRGHLVRRLAIACIVLLCLTAFFTLTKPGVALATSIRNFIVQIFDGSLTAQSIEPPGELPPIDYENIPETFSSLEEAAKTIGRPVVDVSMHDSTKIISITPHMHDDGGIDIQCEYRMPSNKAYYVVQYFYASEMTWSAYGSTRDEDIIKKILPNDSTMYIGTHDDGTAFGESFDAGTHISILSIELTTEELLNIVDEIVFIEP